MRARNKIYHIDCFRCVACSRQLIPGDEFALRDEAGLYCKADHEGVERLSGDSPLGCGESNNNSINAEDNNNDIKTEGKSTLHSKGKSMMSSRSLKQKFHFDEIFINGCYGSCQIVQPVTKISSKSLRFCVSVVWKGVGRCLFFYLFCL